MLRSEAWDEDGPPRSQESQGRQIGNRNRPLSRLRPRMQSSPVRRCHESDPPVEAAGRRNPPGPMTRAAEVSRHRRTAMERRIAALIAGALNHRDDSAWEASVSGLVSATATGTPHPTRQIGDASGRWAVLEEVPRSPALPFQAGPAFSLPEQAHGGPAAWSSRCAIAGCGRNRLSGVERTVLPKMFANSIRPRRCRARVRGTSSSILPEGSCAFVSPSFIARSQRFRLAESVKGY